MASFYEWGSTVSGLQNFYEETVQFLLLLMCHFFQTTTKFNQRKYQVKLTLTNAFEICD